jgi:excisionase family DNA binding protein
MRTQLQIGLENRMFFKVHEAADVLGLDERTVRRAVTAGEIPSTKIGAQWLIPTAWLREQGQMGPAAR